MVHMATELEFLLARCRAPQSGKGMAIADSAVVTRHAYFIITMRLQRPAELGLAHGTVESVLTVGRPLTVGALV